MYVTAENLMLGELKNQLPASINIEEYLIYAAQEIDSKLGFIYEVPIDVDALPNSQGDLLRSIHRKLTSGRIIMAATIAHAESTMHAYAVHLIKESQMELMAIANQDVVLVGAQRVDGSGNPRGEIEDAEVRDPFARVPGALNRDEYSAVVAFEENFMVRDILQRPIETWEPGTR